MDLFNFVAAHTVESFYCRLQLTWELSPFTLLLLLYFFTFTFKSKSRLFTRNQMENMSRDELGEELLKLLDVSSKLSKLTEKINDFVFIQNCRYQETVIMIYYKG